MNRKIVSELPHIASDLRFVNDYLTIISRYSNPSPQANELIYGLQTTVVAMICEWQEFANKAKAAFNKESR